MWGGHWGLVRLSRNSLSFVWVEILCAGWFGQMKARRRLREIVTFRLIWLLAFWRRSPAAIGVAPDPLPSFPPFPSIELICGQRVQDDLLVESNSREWNSEWKALKVGHLSCCSWCTVVILALRAHVATKLGWRVEVRKAMYKAYHAMLERGVLNLLPTLSPLTLSSKHSGCLDCAGQPLWDERQAWIPGPLANGS